jgi:AcrR family transcriptional regulator
MSEKTKILKPGPPSARDRILNAAEEVVAEQGAGHMTMDAVAARAGVSKGGLIYHFPSLRDLLQAMLKRFVEQVDLKVEAARAALPDTPARELKAHIEAWFAFGPDSRRTQAALLATVSRDPDMLALIRERRLRVGRALLASAPDPDQMKVLLLAVEGLWMTELLQVACYTVPERARLKETLLTLAEAGFSKNQKRFTKKTA